MSNGPRLAILSQDRIKSIKESMQKTLQEYEITKREISRLNRRLHVLSADRADLERGRLDSIRNRLEVDEFAQRVSAVDLEAIKNISVGGHDGDGANPDVLLIKFGLWRDRIITGAYVLRVPSFDDVNIEERKVVHIS